MALKTWLIELYVNDPSAYNAECLHLMIENQPGTPSSRVLFVPGSSSAAPAV